MVANEAGPRRWAPWQSCSVIASPGCFAQQGVWTLVGMLGRLLILAVVSLWLLVRK